MFNHIRKITVASALIHRKVWSILDIRIEGYQRYDKHTYNNNAKKPTTPIPCGDREMKGPSGPCLWLTFINPNIIGTGEDSLLSPLSQCRLSLNRGDYNPPSYRFSALSVTKITVREPQLVDQEYLNQAFITDQRVNYGNSRFHLLFVGSGAP